MLILRFISKNKFSNRSEKDILLSYTDIHACLPPPQYFLLLLSIIHFFFIISFIFDPFRIFSRKWFRLIFISLKGVEEKDLSYFFTTDLHLIWHDILELNFFHVWQTCLIPEVWPSNLMIGSEGCSRSKILRILSLLKRYMCFIKVCGTEDLKKFLYK